MSSTLRPVIIKHALPALLLCLFSFSTAAAQTTSFTYQGRLTDVGALANGPYDIEFKLFDNADLQQGPTLTNEDVTVIDGSFVVVLDFGDVFDGTPRFLEIGVRPGDSVDAFTVLNPRWPITSTPYAIRSLKAAAADTATTADSATTATNATTADTATDATQLGGVAADQYVKTDDPRLGGEGGNFIQNGVEPQAGANFNISGNGTLGGTLSANNVGIGTATPNAGIRLQVNGDTLISTAVGNFIQFGTPNTETGMSLRRPAVGRADLRFDGSSVKLVAGGDTGPPGSTNGVVVNTAGLVGIGTVNPQAKLEVNPGGIGSMFFGTPNAETGISIRTNATANRADIRFDGSTLKLVAVPGGLVPPSTNGVAINTAGNVGIGTTAPFSKLHVDGAGPIQTTVRSTTDRAVVALDSNVGGQRRVWTLESGLFNINQGLFGIYDATAQRARLTIDPAGVTSVNVLRITAGADFSENFDVNVARTRRGGEIAEKIAAGMLVSIDPISPGKLTLSTRAYDRRVAGILSGAGGVQTGMLMGHEGTLADGKQPVALSGRVYAWVDAAHGRVRPGDLLTTSATPGHAMKVRNHAKAQGAILGKAMTALKQGKGLVLVLVTLQ